MRRVNPEEGRPAATRPEERPPERRAWEPALRVREAPDHRHLERRGRRGRHRDRSRRDGRRRTGDRRCRTAGSSGTDKGGTTGSAGSPGVFTRYKCPAGPFTTPTPATLTPTRIAGVPSPDATINQNGSAFSIVEGPVWIGGALYISEIQNSSAFPQPGAPPPPARIFKITSDDVASVFLPDSGSNGLAIDASGNLLSANHKVGGIVSFAFPAGTPTTLVGTYMGTRFISPNDLTVRSDGTIYFTDPSYQGATGASSQTQTRVYRVPPGSTQVSVVDATLSDPNGITLSLDETKLYVTDKSGLHVYPVSSDGSVGSGSRLAQGVVSGGDGMTIDCAGNLYVAITSSGNVVVVSPAGTSLGTIVISGVQAVTNAAFGGSDHKTLYITAQGGGMSFGQGGTTAPGLFKVTMPLPGMPY